MSGLHDVPDALTPRTAIQVAERCLALLMVVDQACFDAEAPPFPSDPLFRVALTASERSFLADPEPSEQDCAQFGWRAEALISLLWALGHVPSVYPLNEHADLLQVSAIESALKDPAAFVRSARLRSLDELQAAEQDLYQQHWRVRNALLNGRRTPPDLDPGIVQERRHGLSWLVGWGDNWDEVPTDT